MDKLIVLHNRAAAHLELISLSQMSLFRVVFVALLCFQLFAIGRPRAIYKIVRVQCEPDPAVIRNATCKLSPINWQMTYLDMDCEIIGSVRNVTMHLQLFQKNDVNRFQPFLVNVTVNLCDILSRNSYSTYGTMFLQALRRQSNINHSCPYTGHLTVKKFLLEQHQLPILLPYGQYRITSRFFHGYPPKFAGVTMVYLNVFEERRRIATTAKPRGHL